MKRVFLGYLLAFMFISCSENSTDVSTEIESGKVFAVGSKYGENKDKNFTKLATIWVDGVPTVLSNLGVYSVANAIAFYNNDVYVAGTESFKNGDIVLKIWKNNLEQSITDGSHRVEARDIFVDKESVYIVGNEYIGPLNSSVATIWKNGVASHLTDNSSSEATAICVYNGDVYVSGFKVVDGNKIAVVWKNGVENVLLSFADVVSESIATDICVTEKEVYVTGNLYFKDKSIVLLWKNNVPIQLSDENDYTIAKSLFVYDNEVYVCGNVIDIHIYNSTGKIWKNGKLVKEIADANLESICIKNNKIYLAGEGLDVTKTGQIAKIWQSDLGIFNFIEPYKFLNDEIKAVVVQ